MDELLLDVKYAVRSLRRRPAFVFIVVLTLALGIGSNTAIFSVVNGFLLRPLPYPKPDRLMALYETRTSQETGSVLLGQIQTIGVSYTDFLDWRRLNSVFQDISVFTPQSVNFTGVARPDRMRGGFVSANFFSVLGVDAALGRTFLKQEDQPGSRVVLLQQTVWRSRFGSDPLILGKKLTLNGEPFTVIGVMPSHFEFPLDETEIWMPAATYPGFSLDRTERNYFALGRLKEDVSLTRAQNEMNAIARRLGEQFPDQNAGISVKVDPLRNAIVQDLKASLLILLGAVGFILLIGCGNIANLLLSLSLARRREFSIKAAIGAPRSRLIRQTMLESILLGIMGGLAGLLFGIWGVDVLLKISPLPVPGGITVGLDKNVLGFTFLVSVLAGIIFGLAPALQLSSTRLFHFLREGGDFVSRDQGRASRLLVIAQISLSLILLIGSGLLIKSLWQLVLVNPGIRTENLLSMEYRLPRNKYAAEDQQWRFHQQVIDQIRQVTGVESAAIVRGLPFSGNGSTATFVVSDRALPPKGSEPTALFNTVSIDYFQTIGISLLKGRNFQPQDDLKAPLVSVINEKLANQIWPGEDPIGKRIHFTDEDMTATVIGIVGNAKQYTLNEEFQPQIYIPLSQNPGIFATIVVRTAIDPMSLAEQVKGALWKVDKDQPVWKVRTVQFLLNRDVSARKFLVILLVAFAILALLLTLVGLYGVVSHFVRRRIRDIGIRVALGAQRHDILRMVLRQGIALTTAGILLGVAGAIAITRIMTSLLFQVKPSDPVTIVLGIVFLVGASLLTSLIPAYRATRIDPIKALHYE
jgi:putative ABC transport system permease protein